MNDQIMISNTEHKMNNFQFINIQLISSSGIKQNVYGYTETGIRVWGGGIVKLSQREWKPWPIDLLLLQYQRKIEKERKEQLEIELAEEERKRALKEEESMKIYTTSATGEGLTCVSGKI